MRWLRKGDSGLSLPLFALAHAALLLGVFRTIYTIDRTGIDLYYGYAGRIAAGQLPYRDFVAEYPPLALLFFTVPRWFGHSYAVYYSAFQLELLAFDLVAVVALSAAARAFNVPRWRLLAAYTVAIVAVGPITMQQYDMIPATLTLLALVAYQRESDAFAGVLLGLGTMAKVYPVLLAPLLAIDAWQRGSARRIVVAASAFVAACVVVALPWLARAPMSLGVLASYHGGRGIQIESTWAAISLVAREMRLTWVEVNHTFGSFNITGPLTDAFARISTLVLLAALAIAYFWFFRRVRSARTPVDLRLLGRASLVVLLVSLATSKVFSPQYLLWIAPFIALADSAVVVVVFALIGALTVFVYPYHYEALLARDMVPIVVLALRDAFVIALAFVVARLRPGAATAPA